MDNEMTKQNTSGQKKVIVFGSSGLIGRKICEKVLYCNYKLIEAGRSKVVPDSLFLESDFSNLESIEKSLQDIELENGDTIIFSHRGRHCNYKNEEESMYSNIKIEINPYLALHKLLRSERFEGLKINVVNITSNAHKCGANDISFSYHITKAAQAAAGQMLAYTPKIRIFSNNISFGEAINSSIKNHSDYHSMLFEKARKHLNGKDLPTTDQIGNLAIVLCNADQYSLSGQTLFIDSGLSHLSIESTLRSTI